MNTETKTSLGIAFMIIGSLWFLFDFLSLPPGLMILAFSMHGYPHFVEQHFRVLWQMEFLFSSVLAAMGLVLYVSQSRHLAPKHYIAALGLASLVSGMVFRLFGWFPFSK